MTPCRPAPPYRESMSFVRRNADPLIGLALAVLMAVEVWAHEGADTARAVPAALVAGLALSLRRRLALASFLLAWAGLGGVLAFAAGVDGESLAFIVIFFVAHYSLGRWTVGREAPAGAVLVLASMVVFAVGDSAENDVPLSEVGLGSIAFTMVFVGGPWAAGLAIRLRQERETVLDAKNRELQSDQEERARLAVAEERARIARELHDVVSHAISVTVLQARGARRTLGRDEDQVRRALDAIEQTNTAALSDMRRLLAVLRDTEPNGRGTEDHTPQPSLAHLDLLLDQVRSSGVPVDLEVAGNPRAVPPGVDLSAYRIVQEALTNVLKHAGPATAQVRLDYDADQLRVIVADDGAGGSIGDSGHGLVGIRERVAVVGGEVSAGPGADGGFVITARLPYSVEFS